MDKKKLLSTLFYGSAIYDGVLGLLFLCAPGMVFNWFHVCPPNHPGYVQFPAALLIIFALIFCSLGKNPNQKELIAYGILLKLSYSGLTLMYWLQGTLPGMWKPFTICDIAMGFAYLWAYNQADQLSEEAANDPSI